MAVACVLNTNLSGRKYERVDKCNRLKTGSRCTAICGTNSWPKQEDFK